MLVGGRYETIRELGRGGFSKTYLAEDTYRRGRATCVVKRIQPQSKLPSVLQKARDVFEAEAQLLYPVGSHDQIPKFLDHLEQGGDFFLVQELVDGHDMRQSFTLGDRWDEKTLITFLREVLEIVEFVHQHHVIHRDIKPQNLLRRWRDKKLVLIDFSGIKVARSIMVNGQGDTIFTQPIGTPEYMPKEQADGKPQLCSDIYAVGMMGIQAATGYTPNQLPRNPGTQELEWRDETQISPHLIAILEKMVRFDPNDRYQSAAEVLEALPDLAIARASADLGGLLEPSQPRYKLMIEPSFSVARDFSEDLAAVVVDDHLGYINLDGEFVIQPDLEFSLVNSFREEAYQFSEGLAQTAIAYKWGYINRAGKSVIKPRFDSAEMFLNGLARVEIDQHYGYIDRTGIFIIHPKFESAAQMFREGLAGVEINHRYGFIDKTGRVVIPPRFDSADEFWDGLARVTLNNKYGFIDRTGVLVIPAEFDVAHTFKEGLARVRIEGKYGYINRTGAIAIAPQFDDTFSFTEGLALVRDESKYGYIDPTGKMIIPLQFNDAYPFSEGLAAVNIDNQWGYIDKSGAFVVDPQFDDARSFRNGRAAVKIGQQWGYLGVER